MKKSLFLTIIVLLLAGCLKSPTAKKDDYPLFGAACVSDSECVCVGVPGSFDDCGKPGLVPACVSGRCGFTSSNTDNTSTITRNKLDLSNQGLTQVSQDIFTQTNLEELDISGNKLTGALPAEIRHLKNLRILNASNNLMTGVPAEIGQLENLEILNLSNNRLTGLPYELGNLKKLKILDLSGNNASAQDLEIIKRGLPPSVNIIL